MGITNKFSIIYIIGKTMNFFTFIEYTALLETVKVLKGQFGNQFILLATTN